MKLRILITILIFTTFLSGTLRAERVEETKTKKVALNYFQRYDTLFGIGDNSRLDDSLRVAIANHPESALFRVIITMEAQYNQYDLRFRTQKLKSRKEKMEFVVNALQQFAENSQRDLMSFFDNSKSTNDVKSFWLFNGLSCQATAKTIVELSNNKKIKSIRLDKKEKMINGSGNISNNNSTRNLPYNIAKVNADDVWNIGIYGKDILVAVIDGGVNYNHTDLTENMWEGGATHPHHGWDFHNNDDDPMDDNGHGTHVAGTVAGNGSSGTQTGIAPASKIMAIKVMGNDGYGYASNVILGIQFAVANGVDILNLSLGNDGPGGMYEYRMAMDNVLNAGVIASVAAGNNGANLNNVPIPYNVGTPGNCPPPWLHPNQLLTGGVSAVVCVGATDEIDSIAYFSSIGPSDWSQIAPFNDYPYQPEMGLIRPDICAPGMNIVSLGIDNNFEYVTKNGTSMATPCVTGVMALLLSKNPDLTPAQIDSIIETTALPLSLTKSNIYGSGLIDALAAIQAVHPCNVDITSYHLNDSVSGNNSGKLNPGETASLDMAFSNVTQTPLNNIQIIISTDNPNVNIIDENANYGNFAVGETKSLENAFTFYLSDQAPVNQFLQFTFSVINGDDTCSYNSFHLPTYKYQLEYSHLVIDDSATNNNNILEFGETADLEVYINNSGNDNTQYLSAKLTSFSGFVSIDTTAQIITDLLPGESVPTTFSVTLPDSAVNQLFTIPFSLTLTDIMDRTSVLNFVYNIALPDTNNIIYVAPNGTGYGSSWQSAIGNLQFAIDIASLSNPPSKVWVSAGTYKGDSISENAFYLSEDVNIYGGFSGYESASYDLSLRSLDTHKSILDGQNVQRVLNQTEFYSNPNIVDGFSIRNGHSSGDGGGAYLANANLLNCSFTNNFCGGNGGGIALGNGNITNCLVANNSAQKKGGGIWSYVNTAITNSTVVNNLSSSDGGLGTSYSNVTNCIFWGNKAGTVSNQISGSGYFIFCALEDGHPGSVSFNNTNQNIPLSARNEGFGLSPKFISPSDGAGSSFYGGNWQLQDGSICINRGTIDPGSLDLPLTDISGNTRIQQGRVDIGCYETPYELSLEITPDTNNIVYVKKTSAGSQNGSSWGNASRDLQLTLTLLNLSNIKPKIYVASGTYYGDSLSESAFTMLEGIDVYGGFVGNEPSDFDLSLRDFDANPSILDGQNSQRVLYQISEFVDTTRWNGFTLQMGYTANTGGGASLLTNSHLINCNIVNNKANSNGGGVYAYESVTLTNCEISNNSGDFGGGVHGRFVTLNHCRIHHNFGPDAGGLFVYLNSVVNDCEIFENWSTGVGVGGVFCKGVISNCSISNNYGGYGGGAYIQYDTKVINSFIIGNTGLYAGGVYADNSVDVALTNCEIRNNIGEFAGGIHADNTEIINCNIIKNQATQGAGGVNAINASLTNCILWGNIEKSMANQLSGTGTISYNAIQGGYTGIGNIDIDSLNFDLDSTRRFVQFLDPDSNQYRLLPSSACIDAGDTTITLPQFDLAGMLRIQNGRIDIGAYEYRCTYLRTITDTISYGNIYYFYDREITDAGTYMHLWQISEQCDSLVMLVLIPTCPKPINITVKPKVVSAEISWQATGSATTWNIEYGPTGFSRGSGIELIVQYNTTCNISGLDPAAGYDVYLQSDCSGGDYSSWSSVTTFTTCPIVYVTPSGAGSQDGTSWIDATANLQDAVYTPNAYVWVAAGTYYGDSVSENAFLIPNGVNVFGGFIGNEPIDYDLSLRNFETNASVLDGQNVQRVSIEHIMYNPIFYQKATLNGFSIQNGNAIYGGGVYGSDLIDCSIHDNVSSGAGGGTYRSQLTNCSVYDNVSPQGGGAYYSQLTNCLIVNNIADGGGGIANSTAINSTIVMNQANPGMGGGAYYLSELLNCIVWHNSVISSTVSYSSVEGGADGEGNIILAYENDGNDPNFNYVRFVNPSDSADFNWQLSGESACIDKGKYTLTGLGIPSVDLAGNSRIVNGRIDMGAYEYQTTDPVLNLKVFLEGPFKNESGLMDTTLNANSLLSNSQPYYTSPWNYAGTENVTSIPTNAVDWVLVELRQAGSPELATPATILEGWPRALILKQDGSIVDTNGNMPLIGNTTITENLYGVIRHRNHIDIMSNDPIELSENVYSFNFTDALTRSYGAGAGYKEIAPGIFGMVAGDGDADGSVYMSDRTVWRNSLGVVSSYEAADYDMDGNSFMSDRTLWRSNLGVTSPVSQSLNSPLYKSQVPNNY